MIVFILVLALVLRLINLNQSLWLDEAVQAVTAQRSLGYIFEEIKGDFHPPLYHFLMHFWVRFFGSAEISLRLPSVLFGVGTVWIVYLIAKEISIKNPNNFQFPHLSALLMATAPFHVYYSQEARMYGLSALLVSLSTYYFLKIAKIPKSEIEGGKKVDRYLINLTLYILFTALAIYTDYLALFVLVSQIIIGLILREKKLISFWVAVLLLYPLVLPLLVTQIRTGIAATKILPSWGRLVNLSFLKALPLTLIKFSIGRITLFDKRLYLLFSLVLFAVQGGLILKVFYQSFFKVKNISKSLTGNYRRNTVLFWFILPLIVSWLASILVPNYQPFRLLLILPAFYLILTFGISSLPTSIKTFAFVFILLINLVSLTVYYRNPYFYREDWRGLSDFIKRQELSIVISAKAFDWPLVYYQVGNRVISVVGDLRPIDKDDQTGFSRMIGKNRQLAYTPYLADVYDPQGLVKNWFVEAGFVRIKEISFNQIPLWVYERGARSKERGVRSRE